MTSASQMFHLRGERVGDRHREVGQVLVVNVVKHLRQHVRAGQRELERPVGESFRTRAGLWQIERAGPDRALDHGRRTRAEFRCRLIAIDDQFLERHARAHAGHRLYEILDHPVGLGMVHVEAVELAVADEIDAGLLLRVDDDARRVDHRLLGRQRAEPVGKRIRADDGRLDARLSHRLPNSRPLLRRDYQHPL